MKKFTIERHCVNCLLCSEISPENFDTDTDEYKSFVHKQPETPEEEKACIDAAGFCPVEAIIEID